MGELPQPFCIGHYETKRLLPVTAQAVRQAHEANYDMVTCPITTAHFHSRVLALLSASLAQPQENIPWKFNSGNYASITLPELSPLDTFLTPDQSLSQVIGTICSWIDLGSSDPIIADLSRQILKLELTYAAFCGITYVLIPGPKLRRNGCDDGGVVQYSRAILDALSHGPYMQIHIWLPLIGHAENEDEKIGDLAPFVRQEYQSEDDRDPRPLDLFGTWSAWNTIRSMCKYHSRLCVALSLPKFLPPVPIQSRWYSEPVRLFALSADVFSKNAKGYPVLSKAHQALVSRFMKLRSPPWFLLCDVGPLPVKTNSATSDINNTAVLPLDDAQFPSLADVQSNPVVEQSAHLSYMRNLQNKQPQQSQLERFGAGYQDYLQAPLQPLTVNLESITYEVFEKDPIKYDWYERAIARALHDWIEQGKPTSGPDGRVVIAVVGAGRGPLVTRALKASEDVDVEIDMWALEKNPNAFVLLQRHNDTIWNNRVSLVKSDMRTWRGPFRHGTNIQMNQPAPIGQTPSSDEQAGPATYTGDLEMDQEWLRATVLNASTHYKVDILISELLGSFADNELSPECLDGVQHLINPTHGISIPASYTAHVSPIAAPKLHADITNQSIANPNAPETPYVVMLHSIDHLSTTQPSPSPPPQPTTYSTTPTVNALQNRPAPGPATVSGSGPRLSGISPTPTPIVRTAWSFHHPNAFLPSTAGHATSSTSSSASKAPPTILTNAHNARHASLAFPIPNRGTAHGIAGYFETVLYAPTGPGGKVELSTNPVTMAAKSEGMISWFPIYFPLKIPIYAPDDSEMVVHMWRQTDERKVWYEWMVDVYASPSGTLAGGSDDRKGRAVGDGKVRIGGSELHTSIKEACLM